MIFFAGFCLGSFVAIVVFMVLANWRKPDSHDWLKEVWKRQIELTEEKVKVLRNIADRLTKQKM